MQPIKLIGNFKLTKTDKCISVLVVLLIVLEVCCLIWMPNDAVYATIIIGMSLGIISVGAILKMLIKSHRINKDLVAIKDELIHLKTYLRQIADLHDK